MNKKLTGREAVIALMQGKNVRKTNAPSYFYFSEENKLCRRIPSGEHEECDFGVEACFFRYDDWEIVPEPMVWEGVESVIVELTQDNSVMYATYPPRPTQTERFLIQVPETFANKRVKVRIEEIL